MLVIWLLVLSYSQKKVIKVPTNKRLNRIFLIILFLNTSKPFAIMIVAGMVKNTISEPFFSTSVKANSIATTKFTISSNQLILKELFTDSALGVLIIRHPKVSIKIVVVNHR